mgnify:CR=1 FL=1|jgi:hypothetical protein
MAAKKSSKKTTVKKSKGGRSKGSGPTKSDFVREKLKAGMSAGDIVKAAAASGLKVAPTLVYKLRSTSASKTSKTGRKKGGKLSPSDFVRRYPDKSASEVVELAKKAGVKVSAGLVYTTRSYDKKKGGGASAPKGKPGPKPKGKGPKILTANFRGGAAEEQFKKLLGAIGIDRAKALIEEAASWGRVFGVVK